MIRHFEKSGSTPRNAITRDHVEPRASGGKNKNNLVAACSLCNGLRGDMEAEAFYNLMQKWFRRDPALRHRWYSISAEEYYGFHLECIDVMNRQLRSLGRKSKEHAFRHFTLIREHGHKIQLRA
jgi:hypothetical protein